MNEAALIIGMAAVTFAVRYPVLAVVGRVPLPNRVFRALRYVPAAVLTAIVVPAALMPEGALDLAPGNAYLVASLLAVLVAWRTKNLLLTIVSGMLFFLLWRALFPL